MARNADYEVGISDELRRGIDRYYHRVTALGGFGARVTARTVGTQSRTITGVLGEAGSCQPTVTTDDARRYVIDLESAVALRGAE